MADRAIVGPAASVRLFCALLATAAGFFVSVVLVCICMVAADISAKDDRWGTTRFAGIAGDRVAGRLRPASETQWCRTARR